MKIKIEFRCPKCGGQYFGSMRKEPDGPLLRHCSGRRTHGYGGCTYEAYEWDDHLHFVALFANVSELRKAERRVWSAEFKARTKKVVKEPRQDPKKKTN